MPTRTAQARWEGDLRGGLGRMMFGSGAFDGAYSFGSRFESGAGTNPEELLGAAHAGCFSMSLANMLAQAGHAPESVETEARVDIEKGDSGFSITRITLVTEASVPGISEEEFQRHARAAKEGCPVSRALAATEIALEARLRA